MVQTSAIGIQVKMRFLTHLHKSNGSTAFPNIADFVLDLFESNNGVSTSVAWLFVDAKKISKI